MIKMILADDEPVITRGIQKLVDWKRLGIEVVGEYQDGKAALDGILTQKPEIALLDIYMPKMTGIEILKEIKTLGISTQVIFISGFQDFQYAKDALRYGAEDYLLKPVIKEELINSIGRCCALLHGSEKEERKEEEEPLAYDKLVQLEETIYLPVLLDILWNGTESRQERKLIRFSVVSFVEEYLKEHELGIVFSKNDHVVAVLKGTGRHEAKQIMYELMEALQKANGHRIGAVIGEMAETMGQIPARYASCLKQLGYFFFEDQISVPILMTNEPVFLHSVMKEEFEECRGKMLEAMITQNQENYQKWEQRFYRLLCVRAEGKKEDACFHFCTTVRIMEEKMKDMGLPGLGIDIKDLLEKGRETQTFYQMTNLYQELFTQYYSQIRESVVSNDKKDILYAKNYIQEHYSENLTLEVLARQVHMNPYYFSSFFKKNSGKNFKDYLNQVRIQHAMSLLVSTDMKTYEIADRVGFRDVRSFTDLFQKLYKETPASYRKRLKQ